jgi:hypothetical protein
VVDFFVPKTKYIIPRGGIMGCGCGGNRPAAAPRLPPATGKVTDHAGKLHPNVQQMQNILKMAEESRRVQKLRREQLLKALSKP